MKRYINTENERYRFYVRPCLNGFAIQVLVVPTEEHVPLTPQVAAQLQITLPDTYRLQSCTREAADAELVRLAEMNGWVEVN